MGEEAGLGAEEVAHVFLAEVTVCGLGSFGV